MNSMQKQVIFPLGIIFGIMWMNIIQLIHELHQSLDEWMVNKPTVVGTCCGATPEDTALLVSKFK